MSSEQGTALLQRMMTPYEGKTHTVVAFGHRDGEAQFVGTGPGIEAAPLDELIFEIGSITKVFTATLLWVLVEEGKVDPKAPLRDLSSELSVVPDWITPERLTSHTSGLPRIHVPIWKALIKPLPKDPYAAFSRADLLDWLRNWPATPPRSTPHHSYSNLGIGLLGEALAIKEGRSFMELLTRKVFAPLGMKDTAENVDADSLHRFMHPKNTKGVDAVPWTFQSMAAAGCLRSTAGDLNRFAAGVLRALNAPETKLDRAICHSVQPIVGLGPRGRFEPAAQCSGWFQMTVRPKGLKILHHDGGTAGSTSALYICPERNRAVGVLSNNGVAASLWAGMKLGWSNPLKLADAYFLEN
ncbi:MAG: serine hydrolase domain-containing protein [Pseudomonadota bacterium]|nr:serine hydrolase domain-containing protein [Pseudomonadota bacterium]